MKKQNNARSGASENKIKKSEAIDKENRIITDPFGSWTGVVEDNIYEKPVQDVDDL